MANSDGLKLLVIVESATKARKIQPYLGDDYIVEASVGHIRDLPRGAADVPARYKKAVSYTHLTLPTICSV